MRLLSAVRVLLSLVVLLPRADLCAVLATRSSVVVPRLINISGVFQPADGQPAGAVESSPCRSTPSRRAAPAVAGDAERRVDAPGRYTLLLGATQADGIPAAVFASGEAQWLGTVFARAGEVEGPRVRITSVPVCAAGGRRRHARRPAGLGLPAGADRGAGRPSAGAASADIDAGATPQTSCCPARRISSPST